MTAAVGIGCRAGATAEAIARLARQACARAGIATATLHAAASIRNPALAAAAAALDWPLRRHDAAALANAASRVVSHSARITALHGVGSLAEAAALAGAGEAAVIVVPKFSADGVSCAVAR